jgi:hypothetical protein
MPGLEERVAALEAAIAALTAAEPDFMARTRAEPLHDTEHLNIRLTHEPTGITVAARDRQEAIYKLRQALAGAARRQYDLQERERRAQEKAAQAEKA